MESKSYFIDSGLKFHVREWSGNGTAAVPFVLLHGLSSNSRTWSLVAAQLASAGHRVVAIDQRGHGLSDKPDDGYDFATITADLSRLLEKMSLENPILVGQSWGGNVLLEFGARYPGTAAGLGFVDGGFLDLQSRPGATWESVSTELKPPNLLGTPRETLKQRLKAGHPDWDDEGIEATMDNFETLLGGTIRPHLTLNRHLAILRSMWEQRPTTLYQKIREPVLVCAARNNAAPEWTAAKARQISNLEADVRHCEIRWFDDTDHDIHIHRPDALANLLLKTLENGIWSKL